MATLEQLNAELEPFGVTLTAKGIVEMQQRSLHRTITGISATLLPLEEDGVTPAWEDFSEHVGRTVEAGLIPAVNMDTGYRNLITEDVAGKILDETHIETAEQKFDAIGGQPFVAGAFVRDGPGAPFDLEAYCRQIDLVKQRNGVPVITQSYGLTSPGDIVERYRQLASRCGQFIAFELGPQFAPFGKIYNLPTYAGLLEMKECIGAKHSSLDRGLELQRLALRNKLRANFMVLTGNDLAIDTVRYGSDYLLGLSTAAPDRFAERDRAWIEGDLTTFDRVNDSLQELGAFAFRKPTPAYKHSMAQFLHLRGWIESSETLRGSPRRPQSDTPILRRIGERLGVL